MFTFHSVKDYHNALLSGQTTCVKAVLYFIQRIKDNLHLNAFLEVFEEEAVEYAAALDKEVNLGKPLKKLHGVVFSLKDVICYKGHLVSASSHILEGFRSVYSATAVEKLVAEGAIIIGRTNCDEFAMGSSNENSPFGNVLNAIDNTKVPGGSSGGSAVSVQAGLSMISLGSDTGGSVRQPADFCGIVGFKPSYGVVSRYGLIAYASSFDQIGIFAKNVEDVSLTLEVIKGSDAYDSTSVELKEYTKEIENERPLRIAYFKQALNHPGLNAEIAASFYTAVKDLQEQGNMVEAVEFELFDYIVPAYYILTTAEASSNLSRFDGIKYGSAPLEENLDINEYYSFTRSNGFGKEVKRRIMLGNFVLSAGYYDAYFTKAQQIRTLLIQKSTELFKIYDIIISPTVPAPAFSFNEKLKDPIEMFLADIYTVFPNLVGIPAISIPLFKLKSGMPFGMQVMSFDKNDLFLLNLAERFLHFYQNH